MILIAAHAGFSQTTLQVVTKRIEKTFTGSQTLNIEAEKADIEVITWEKQEIKAEIELIAKHPDRKIATTDLETMKHVADKIGKEVFLRNYLLIRNEKEKPSSNLKAKYTIHVPEGMKVTIQNSFGKISIKGKSKLLKIKSDFCIIDLDATEGTIELNTHYGEINIKTLNGISTILSERTDLIINQLGGKCEINNHYGKLNIISLLNLKSLNIDAQKSEVLLDGLSLKNYCFNVSSKFGKMTLPSEFSWQQNDKILKSAILNSTLPTKIDIKNSFGNITIKN